MSRLHLPNEREVYEFAGEMAPQLQGYRMLLAPISDSSIGLANCWEQGLYDGGFDSQNLVRLDLKKGGYIDDSGNIYKKPPDGIAVYREILTPPEQAVELAGDESFDLIWIFDDTSNTGKNGIGGYVWGLEANDTLREKFTRGKQAHVVLYIDRDSCGNAHVTRMHEYLTMKRTRLKPDTYLKTYFPETYARFEVKGLVPQHLNLRLSVENVQSAHYSSPPNVAQVQGGDESPTEGAQRVLKISLRKLPRRRLTNPFRIIRDL